MSEKEKKKKASKRDGNLRKKQIRWPDSSRIKIVRHTKSSQFRKLLENSMLLSCLVILILAANLSVKAEPEPDPRRGKGRETQMFDESGNTFSVADGKEGAKSASFSANPERQDKCKCMPNELI